MSFKQRVWKEPYHQCHFLHEGKLCRHVISWLGTFLLHMYVPFNSLVPANDNGLSLQSALLQSKAEQPAPFLRDSCQVALEKLSSGGSLMFWQLSSFCWPCQAASSHVPEWLAVFSKTGTAAHTWTMSATSCLMSSKTKQLQPPKSQTSSSRETGNEQDS